jgi:hypothetical protein
MTEPEKECKPLMDDKFLVIVGLCALGLFLCFCNVPSTNVPLINSIISGLLGAAVGRGMR